MDPRGGREIAKKRKIFPPAEKRTPISRSERPILVSVLTEISLRIIIIIIIIIIITDICSKLVDFVQAHTQIQN
jgi:hypothetical protein